MTSTTHAGAVLRGTRSGEAMAEDVDPRPTDGRRLRWTQHRAQRRAAFVESGVVAIDTFGTDASAEQIAETAGVSRTVLYRYFRDRDDLRGAIAERVVQDVLGRVLPTLELTPSSTPHELIVAGVGVIVTWIDEHPNLYHFLRTRRVGSESSLESVESTLADRIAGLLTVVMVVLGIDGEHANPGAHGIVGFVEASSAWWLQHRGMSRERFIEIVTMGVWHLLEGTAREYGLEIGFDDPLPMGVLATEAPS